MRFFFWKKNSTDEIQSVDGIFRTGKNAILSLREKVWKFEIYPSAIISYIKSHPHGVFVSICLVIIAVAGLIRMSTSAAESYFYPTSCLGGWSNPELATGEPDVKNGNDSSFSENNSAVLDKSISDLYCGGFSGEVPSDITAGVFTVHFSWLVSDHVLPAKEINIDSTLEGVNTTTKDEILNTDESLNADELLNNAPLLEEVKPEEVKPEEPKLEENIPLDLQPIIIIPDQTPTNTPELVPVSSLFISVARAQETPIAEESPILINETEEISKSGDFLEALYSLDGTEWKHLGYVSTQNWRGASFVIDEPKIDWEAATKIQIELKSLPSIDEPVVIYLDSVYVTVSHKEEDVVLNPPKILIKDPSINILSGKENFQSGESPSFSVKEDGFSTNDLTNYVDEKKMEIIEDPAGTIGEPIRANPIITTEPITILDPIKEIINPVIPDMPVITNTPVIPDTPIAPEQTIILIPTDDAPSPVSFFRESKLFKNKFLNNLLSRAGQFFSTKKALAFVGEITATVLDSNGNLTDIGTEVVTVSVNGSTHREVRVNQSRDFRPGHYTLRVSLHTPNAVIVSEQNFTWGVLALNFDKTVYQSGDNAYIQIGVLNDVGHTLCFADVEMSITSPSGNIDHFSTANNTATANSTTSLFAIVRDAQCGPDNVISVPDYFAHYIVPSEIGTYSVSLTAVTDNGTKTISDSFLVSSSAPINVIREAPTRIYPWAVYPVRLKVTSPTNWQGTITEKVPASFLISQPTNGIHYDDTTMHLTDQDITWNVSLVAGEEITLGYDFDAPNISPEFFLIGPAVFTPNSGPITFQENRSWQIASDAACNATVTGTWSATASFTSCTGAASGGAGTGNRPGAADSLTINSGVVITADTTVTITALTFAASTVAASLNVANGVAFTVTGATSIPAVGAANVANTITAGGGASGSFSTNGITITGNATTARNSILALPLGSTFTSTNGITFAGTAAEAQITNAGAATINLTGTMSTGGTVTINAGTTLNTSGTVTLSRATTFGILSVNSGTTTMGAVAISFAGTTTVASGATLTVSSATGAKVFTGAVTVNSTGVFDLKTGTNFATASTFGGNITMNGTTFNSGTGAVTLTGTGARSWSGGSAMSLGGTMTIPTNIQLTNNITATVTIGVVAVASPTASNSFTLATGTTTAITGLLSFSANAAAGQSQLLTLQGTAALSAGSITMAANTSTGTKKITATGSGGSLTVSGTTLITGSATASGGLSSIDFSTLDTNFTTNTLTVTAGTTGAASVIMGTGTFMANGLVTLTGAASGIQLATLTTVTGTLDFNAGLTQSGTVIANATLTTTGAATVTFTGTMTGAGTKTLNSTTTFNTTGTVALNAAITLPTLNVLAGTTTLGAVAITVTGATNITGALANASSATLKTFTGLVTINSGGSVALTTATVPAVTFGGGITTVAGAGTVNFGTGATIFNTSQSISGPVSITVGASTINSGVTLTNSNTGTFTMGSLVIPIATVANTLSLSDGSVTSVTGLTSFTANTQANAQSILMNGTANFTSGTLTINAPTGAGGSLVTCLTGATGTFTVTGAMTVTGNSTSTGPVTLAFLTCTLMANGLVTVNGGTNTTGAATISSSTGILDFNAGLTFANTLAQARMTTTGAGSINLTGTMSGLGTLSLNSATVFTTTGVVAINSAYTLPDLNVASGTTTTSAAIILSDNLDVAGGSVFKFGPSAYTITGVTTVSGSITCQAAVSCTGIKTFTGAVTVNSGGVFDITNGSVVPTTTFAGGITMDGTTFNTSTGATTFATNNQNLSGSSAITIGGAVTINSGVTLTNDNTSTVTMASISIPNPTTGGNGMSLSTGSTTTVSGAITYAANSTANNITMTMNGTANLSAGSLSLLTPSSTGSNLFTCAGGSGTFAVSGVVTYAGNAVTTGASTIDMDTCTMTIGGLLSIGGGANAAATLSSSSGVISIGAGLTFSGTGANARLTTTGASTINLTGTVSAGGVISLNSGTTVYTTGTTVINNSSTMGGNLTISSGATTLGAVALTISGATTIDGGTLAVSSATGTKTFTGAVVVNSGSFDFSAFAAVTSFAGGITMNGTTFNSGTSAGTTTFSATQELAGSSAMVFGGAATIGNSFTLTNNNTSTVDFNSNLIGSNASSTLATGLNSTTRFAGTVLSTGILIPWAGVNTIEYDGGTQTIKTATTNLYYNLTISAAGTKSLAATTAISNLLTISAGSLDTVSGQDYSINSNSINIGASGTLLGQGSTITLTGNWTNSGAFTAGTSTVVLSGGATATVDGTTTFNNLTITHSSAKEVDFATAGTPIFNVTGLFTVTGHAAALIKLYSSNSPTKWQFNPTGTASVDYADVKDGGCEIGASLISPTNSTDSGNNDSCWSFTQTLSFSLSSNALDFGTFSSTATRYASSGVASGGSASEVEAHTISAITNAPSGYSIQVIGSSIKNLAHTITAIGGTNVASSVGTEQFGLRAVATGGNGAVSVPYSGGGFAYAADASTMSEVASSVSGNSIETVYSVRYIGNISNVTSAGSYSTGLTYIFTANY